jgi:hypothetical protein
MIARLAAKAFILNDNTLKRQEQVHYNQVFKTKQIEKRRR